MYDHMLLEMAETLSQRCGVRVDDAMNALITYWQDKIAHVWQVEDVFESALQAGKPITRADAVELLKQIFDGHDSSLGITWTTIECALDDYHLDFARLGEAQYADVVGVFQVWQRGNPICHQFGLAPNDVQHNLPEALAFARQLALEHPDDTVCLGCGQNPTPWLLIHWLDGQVSITESEE